MNQNTLTEKLFAELIGRTEEEVHSLIGEGMPTNPDGAVDILNAIAWQLKNNPLPDLPEGYHFRWKLDEAIEWLEYVLSYGGKSATAVIEKAENMGLSKRTLDHAKARLGIVSKKDGSSWTWELPNK